MILAKLHDAADAIPDSVAFVGAFTAPVWGEYLTSVSHALGLVAQAMAVLLAVYKLWDAYTARKGRTEAAMGAAETVGAVAKKTSLASGSVIGIAAAFLGIFAISSWLSSAKAEPATAAKVVSSTSARKRTKDDAGEDDTVDGSVSVDGAPEWLTRGLKLKGTEEKIGRRNNPAVLSMFADCGHPEIKSTDTPWCAAFVGAMLERSGIPSTKALTARSYLDWGVELDTPRVGCLVVMWRGPRDDGFSGHIGFFLSETDSTVTVLGGNQGDAVSVATFRKSKVLAYRWPRALWKSKTMQGAVAVKAAATAGATASGVAIAQLPPEAPKPATTAEKVGEAVSGLQGPLEQARDVIPSGSRLGLYIAAACCALAFIGAAVVVWQRINIRNETGR